jgi:hypothetical protein
MPTDVCLARTTAAMLLLMKLQCPAPILANPMLCVRSSSRLIIFVKVGQFSFLLYVFLPVFWLMRMLFENVF